MRGLLVTFEGTEGSGKTTQAHLLCEYLGARGHVVRAFREPGGTPVGDSIRHILLSHDSGEMRAETEALLFAAARAQLVHQLLEPTLERGEIAICDRFSDSTLAYQCFGHRLDRTLVEQVIKLATGGLRPALTFYLRIPPQVGMERRSKLTAVTDRIEARGVEYHRRVVAGFDTLSAEDPDRWCVIDGIQSVEAIAELVRARVMLLVDAAKRVPGLTGARS
jgi:dTMP kinase